MNYTINYQTASGSAAVPVNNPVTMSTQLPINAPGQRTLVLMQSQQNVGPYVNHGATSNQQTFPMVMQVGTSNPPVFYTYHTSDGLQVNSAIPSKLNESGNNSSSSGVGQVVLSPVSPVQNGVNIVKQSGSSPNVNMQSENCVAVRSLGDVLAIQSMPGIANPGPILSSLYGTSLQLVDTGLSNMGNVPVSIITNQHASDHSPDKSTVPNFVKTYQPSHYPVVENNADKQVSITLPKTSVEDGGFPSNAPVSGEQMYRIVEGSGNISVIAAGGVEANRSENAIM